MNELKFLEPKRIITIPLCIILAYISLRIMYKYIIKKNALIKEVALHFLDILIVISVIINYILIQNSFSIISYNITITLIFINIGLRKYVILNLKKTYTEICELKSNNTSLRTKNDELSAFQHDFNNIVQTIGGLLATQKYDNLNRYYKGLKVDCQILNDMDLLNSKRINNPEILSLITNKYNLAKRNGIRMNLEINSDLSIIKSDIFHIIRILGIFLDNAIEATKECNEKTLNVIFNSENNIQKIIIENSYIDNNINTSFLFEKGFSTKNGNKGLGLWKVNNIISHSNTLNLNTYKNSNYFTQELSITV